MSSAPVIGAPIGIDVNRDAMLRRADPIYREWSSAMRPAFDRVNRIVPTHEGLTHWRVTKLALRPLIRDGEDILTYETFITTPPARPEWLEVLS